MEYSEIASVTDTVNGLSARRQSDVLPEAAGRKPAGAAEPLSGDVVSLGSRKLLADDEVASVLAETIDGIRKNSVNALGLHQGLSETRLNFLLSPAPV